MKIVWSFVRKRQFSNKEFIRKLNPKHVCLIALKETLPTIITFKGILSPVDDDSVGVVYPLRGVKHFICMQFAYGGSLRGCLINPAKRLKIRSSEVLE